MTINVKFLILKALALDFYQGSVAWPCEEKAFNGYWLMMITPCQIKLNIMHDVDADKLDEETE